MESRRVDASLVSVKEKFTEVSIWRWSLRQLYGLADLKIVNSFFVFTPSTWRKTQLHFINRSVSLKNTSLVNKKLHPGSEWYISSPVNMTSVPVYHNCLFVWRCKCYFPMLQTIFYSLAALSCKMLFHQPKLKSIPSTSSDLARVTRVYIGDLTLIRRRGRRLLENVFIFYFGVSQLLRTIQCVCRY